MPRIEDVLDALSKATWFSKIDLKNVFWQVPMKKSDCWKTAFRTHVGLYEFLVMPFGLCNSPATFQRMVNHVLDKFNFKFCLGYFDEFIIYSETLENTLVIPQQY